MNNRRQCLFVCLLMILCVAMIPVCLYAEEYSLNDLYRIALQRAERIKISQEDLYIAKVGKDKAMALLLPKL